MAGFRYYWPSDYAMEINKSEKIIDLPFHLSRTDVVTPLGDISPELSTDLNIPYAVFEILVALFAIIGNLMVIIVFQRDRKLRRRTNYYIVSLAMADFLVGSLGIPFAILASVGQPKNLYACLFSLSLLVVLCTISIFCLVAVSVDRYWAILYPMAYSRNVRTKTAIGIIAMCWVAGAIVGFLPLFGWHSDTVSITLETCHFVKVMDYNYLVFLYFATIITPALLMLAFYAHIYRVIVKQVKQIVLMNPIGVDSRRTSVAHIQTTPNRMQHGGTMLRVLGAARKRDVKATQNLSIIVLFFMICWLPLYTINCIKAFWPDYYIHPKITFFAIILSHLNSAVNPVLYAYHLRDFRAALKTFILKIFGIEEPQPDISHRYSLASQHRLQSIDKRPSLQAKIYIDSPVWLRQQQKKSDHVITNSLNSVHQTVKAVASATTDLNRDMWNIVEASSHTEKDESPPSPRNSPTEHLDSSTKYSYDNCNFSTSSDDDDIIHDQTTSPVLREILQTENSYQEKQKASENYLTESLSIDVVHDSPKENHSLPQRASVFLVENDRNLLSPDHKPRIKKFPSPRRSIALMNSSCSNLSTTDVVGKMTRSTSYSPGDVTLKNSNHFQNFNNNLVDKFSPLKKAVGDLICSPVRKASMFQKFTESHPNASANVSSSHTNSIEST